MSILILTEFWNENRFHFEVLSILKCNVQNSINKVRLTERMNKMYQKSMNFSPKISINQLITYQIPLIHAFLLIILFMNTFFGIVFIFKHIY